MAIAKVAILLSATSLVYSLYTGHNNKKLTKATIKSNLLTKLIELQIHYQNRIHEIRKLLSIAEMEARDEFGEFSKWLAQAEECNKKSQQVYNDIQSSNYLSSSQLESIRHHVEALTRRAEEISKNLSRFEPLLDGYIAELKKI